MNKIRFQKNNLIATYSKTLKKYRVRPVNSFMILEEFTHADFALELDVTNYGLCKELK